MSSLRRKLTVTRRPSTLLDVPSSSSTQRSAPRSSSPSIISRASSRIRAFYEGTFTDTTPAFEMLTAPSSSSVDLTPAGLPARPQISRLAKSFANAITTQRLSDFLLWFLYYDVVDLPASPETWYAPLTTADARGWIALGTFLSHTQAVGAEYGLDLVVLDSICDRLHLHRSLVHEIFVRFSSPKKMAFGILATTIRRAEQARMAKLPMLIEVQAKLNAASQLAGRLEPTPESQFEVWQAVIQRRVRGLLHLVVGPRIAHVREGKPLLTTATSGQLPKEAKDGIKLNYLFEVVQLERRVPMDRYGVIGEPELVLFGADSTSSSLLGQGTHVDLLREHRDLKETLVRLAHDNRNLLATNEDLTAKLALAMSAWDALYTPPRTSSPSDVCDESSSVVTPALAHRDLAHDDDIDRHSDSPTFRLSEPHDFDLQLAITLPSSPPVLPERHPARPESYLNPGHAGQLPRRRSGFVGRDGLFRLGFDGVNASMLESPSSNMRSDCETTDGK